MKLLKPSLIVLFIILVFIDINYVIFKNKVGVFIEKMPEIERVEFRKHIERKNKWEKIYTDSLSNNSVTDWSSPKEENKTHRFKDNQTNSGGLNDFNNAIIEIDTVINHMFFSKKISYQGYNKKYFECLCYHEFNRWNNLMNLNNQWSDSLKKSMKISDSDYKYLRDIINRKKTNGEVYFPDKYVMNNKDYDCKKIIPGYSSNRVKDEVSIEEFKKLFNEFKKNKTTTARGNKSIINFNRNLYREKTKGLSSSLRKKIDEYWNQNEKKKYKEFVFKGSKEGIGQVEYNLEIVEKIDKSKLSNYVGQLMQDYYKSNSLKTGTFPYSNCFGSRNSCSGYSCSQIMIKNGSTDVIVSVKKGTKVYRHSYIKAYQSFTFNVSDGKYDVYFYYGRGWNPNKKIFSAECNKLSGGFVSDEEVNKDMGLVLYNQIMTYKLTTTSNGNFSPNRSNVGEAF